jgi:hypothetical protein
MRWEYFVLHKRSAEDKNVVRKIRNATFPEARGGMPPSSRQALGRSRRLSLEMEPREVPP